MSRRTGSNTSFCFENRGGEIGVTLNHPHGQVYAYPFVPPRVSQPRDQRSGTATGRIIVCSATSATRESADGRRIVAQTEWFVAFVPWAPRWPLEVHVYARRHVADIAGLDETERTEALMLQADVLRRFDKVFSQPAPYIAAWVQSPVSTDRENAHLRLEVFLPMRSADKLKHLPGSDSSRCVRQRCGSGNRCRKINLGGR